MLAAASACGTVENLTAGQKVDRAVERIGEQKSLAFRLDLDADARTIRDLSGGGDPAEAVPPSMARALSTLHVDVSIRSRKPLADSQEKDFLGSRLKISVADGVLAEYRVVGDFTYYRTDPAALGSAMGFPVPSPDDIPPGREAMKEVAEGHWVKMNTKALGKARKSAGGAPGAGGPDARTQRKILDAVGAVVGRRVTFRTGDGSEGVEHVVATGNVRDLVTGIVTRLRPFQDDLPGGMELPTARDLRDAPDKKISVDFTLRDGDLRRLRVDLAPLTGKPAAGELPLVVAFTEARDVRAPKGATELPPGAMLGAGPGALGGSLLPDRGPTGGIGDDGDF
ncbi:hypothetical protein ACGFS9_16495 [Streptomyces sp. NPDC048566]|uniref:hypothetical protein n=1 Tax=Streptomyces sp. NPDC048566 TaxID=3365569 RepID=UPI003712A78F